MKNTDKLVKLMSLSLKEASIKGSIVSAADAMPDSGAAKAGAIGAGAILGAGVGAVSSKKNRLRNAIIGAIGGGGATAAGVYGLEALGDKYRAKDVALEGPGVRNDLLSKKETDQTPPVDTSLAGSKYNIKPPKSSDGLENLGKATAGGEGLPEKVDELATEDSALPKDFLEAVKEIQAAQNLGVAPDAGALAVFKSYTDRITKPARVASPETASDVNYPEPGV